METIRRADSPADLAQATALLHDYADAILMERSLDRQLATCP